MRISILFLLALSAFAQMPRLHPAPAPTAPPGFEYVDYVDETGQTVPILARIVPTKTIVNDCPGCQQTTPLMEVEYFNPIDYTAKSTTASTTATAVAISVDRLTIQDAPKYVSISTVAPDALPYLYVELEPDYSPKSITIRVDGKDVKMEWKFFESVVRSVPESTTGQIIRWVTPPQGSMCSDSRGAWWPAEPDGTCKAKDIR